MACKHQREEKKGNRKILPEQKKKKQELTGLSDPVYVCVVFCKKKKKKHNVETYNRTLAPFSFFFNYFRSPLQSNRLIQQHFLSLSVEHRNKSLSFFFPSFFFFNLLLAVVAAYVTLSLTLSSSMSCASSLRACAIECREASSPS